MPQWYVVWLSPNVGSAPHCGRLLYGAFSRAYKRNGRALITVHPDDAKGLDLREGETARVINDRGACLATERYDLNLMPDVLQAFVPPVMA